MTAPTPHWSDPTLAITDPGASVEHRSTPLTWKVTGDDVLISVNLSRIDCLDGEHGIEPGDLKITLTLTGDVAASDLTPVDAQMIQAALGCAIERAEKITAQEWAS